MPLEDVSNDTSMIDWLRQSGHGHLLANQHGYSNLSSSSAAAVGVSAATSPPPPRPLSQSPPPIVSSGYGNANYHHDSYNRSGSAEENVTFRSHAYGLQPSPTNFVSSPSQFMAPHMNNPQLDMDIEHMKRDPNTRVIQRPTQEDVVYRQRVFVRYLQPPTPPVSGAIIVREKQPPPPPPDPPIVIRRAPPPPPTPPPVIIRERPPPIPPPEPTTIINKIVPAPIKPPRQVIIEQYPPMPPKPQDVIIERWLPHPPRQRRILYERLPAPMVNQQPTGPIIIQHGQPRVRVLREVRTVPGAHVSHHQILPQIGATQQIFSSVPHSSLVSYSPYSSIQQTYGTVTHPQSNIVVMQNEQPNVLASSSYGMPLSCVCHPNPLAGLATYGSGTSAVPTMGFSAGQSSVYTVPENVSVDQVLRQLGVDPHSLQQQHHSDPHSAVAHVWNAASHANPTHSLDPRSAVSHVWNAAAHASDPSHLGHPQQSYHPSPPQPPPPPSSGPSGVLSQLFGGHH